MQSVVLCWYGGDIKMETTNFMLRISDELNEKLIKIAENEGRSKNKQIEYILKKYVEQYENSNNGININQSYNKKAVVKIKE